MVCMCVHAYLHVIVPSEQFLPLRDTPPELRTGDCEDSVAVNTINWNLVDGIDVNYLSKTVRFTRFRKSEAAIAEGDGGKNLYMVTSQILDSQQSQGDLSTILNNHRVADISAFEEPSKWGNFLWCGRLQ